MLGNASLRTRRRGAYDMGMPDMARKWTREMVLALPDDGNRYELFDGELLVTPAPAGIHQLAGTRLYDRVAPYVEAHSLGVMLWSPADLHLGGDQLSQPDLFVVPSLPPDRYDRAFMDRLIEQVRRSFGFCVSEQSATNSVLLRSPGGKIYEVTVSDVGALVVTYVSG